MAVILSFVLLGVGALKAGCANPTCDAGVATNCGGAEFKGCQWNPAIQASCNPKSASACLSQYSANDACNGPTTGCEWSSQSECARSDDYDCSPLNSAGNACANNNCQKFTNSCVAYDMCNVFSVETCEGMTNDQTCAWMAEFLSGLMNCSDITGCEESGNDCIFDTEYCSTLTTKTACESLSSETFCTWSGSACVARTGKTGNENCKVVGSACASKSPPPVCVTDTSSPSGGCSLDSSSLECISEEKPLCITPPCVVNSTGNGCTTSSTGVGCTFRSGGTCKAKSPAIDCGLATAACGAGKEDIGCISVAAVAASCDVKVGLGCDTNTDQDGCETVGCKWTPADSKDAGDGAGDGAFTVLAPLFFLVISMLMIL